MIRKKLKQLFCDHEIFIEAIVVVNDNQPLRHVRARCCKCNKLLLAPYGLAFNAKLKKQL